MIKGKKQQWILAAAFGNSRHTGPKVSCKRLLINYKGGKISVKWRNLAIQTSDQSQTPTTMGQNDITVS